jgi:Family of unknown function (DUF6355)
VRRLTRWAVAAAMTGAALTAMSGPATAAPVAGSGTSAGAAMYPCYFYEVDGRAFYANCDNTRHRVFVDYVSGADREICVLAQTRASLGSAHVVRNARKIGTLCVG